MRNIKVLLLITCILSLSLNSCTSDTSKNSSPIQTSAFDYPAGWKMKNDVTERFIVKQNLRMDSLIEFEPAQFESSGFLNSKWYIDLDESSLVTDPSGNPKYSFIPMSNSWNLKMSYTEGNNPQNIDTYYIIMPETGSFKTDPVRFGVTNGEYVWVDDYCNGCPEKSLCWHKDLGDIWIADDYKPSDGLFRNNRFYIFNGNLFMVDCHSWNRLSDETLSLINPWNGKISWLLSLNYSIRGLYSTDSSRFLFIECSVRTQKMVDGFPSNVYSMHYYVLDTDSLSIKKVFENKSLQMLATDDKLFCYDGESLQELSDSSDSVESIVPIGRGLKIYSEDRRVYNNTTGDFFVAREYIDGQNNVFLINHETGEKKLIKHDNPQIINHTLITTTDNQIQSINPETLEPIWWIDLDKEDLGDNPRVIWCDWRGVLVMSDTKLACFTE